MIHNGNVKCSLVKSFYNLGWIQIIQSKSGYWNRKVFICKYNFHFFKLCLGRYSYANTISTFNDLCLTSFTRATNWLIWIHVKVIKHSHESQSQPKCKRKALALQSNAPNRKKGGWGKWWLTELPRSWQAVR